MKTEISAGIVIRNKDKYLLLRYVHGHWGFPKGHVEQGESLETTAKREVMEETGLNIEINTKFHAKINYVYSLETEQIEKTVHFFVGCSETKRVVLSDEHVDFKWLSYAQALNQITYVNEKEILKKVDAYFIKKENR